MASLADAVMARLFPEPDPHAGDPSGWIRSRLKEHVWSKQEEICESVVENRYTAVKACHGPGKSWVASRIVSWWLSVHPEGSAFAVTTAPTGPQVEAILWREIARAHRKGGLAGYTTSGSVPMWKAPSGEILGYGRKPADYDQAAFQGIHAEHLLVVVDEACGVPKQLFDAVDSLATNDEARVLAIGNPDDPASHFASCCAPGSGWNVLQISAYDMPAFTGEPVPDRLVPLLTGRTWVEERRKRWGEGSPLWISKVLGEFPEVSDDTLISPAAIRRAQERDLSGSALLDPGRLGVDVARSGPDETVAYRKRGGQVRLEFSRHKQDTMATAGLVHRAMAPHKGRVPASIDVIGIGAGVYDRLSELGMSVSPFLASAKSTRPRRYKNLRAEAYWKVREAFEEGLIDIDPEDDQLASQLGSVRYFLDSAGRIVIESKDDMKRRGMPSPDRADALVMSWWEPSSMAEVRKLPAAPAGITDDLMERAM